MKIGVAGTGNMGSILIDALVASKAVSASDLVITNRTPEKAQQIQKKHPDITVSKEFAGLVQACELLFICVKPHDIHPLLQGARSLFRPEQCVVSITSPVSTAQLESVLPCSCMRMIPSITNKVLSGTVLYTFGEKCEEKWKVEMKKRMDKLCKEAVEIDEAVTRAASDLVSCGPAFISFLTRKFIEGAETTGMEAETAEKLAESMLAGLGELFKQKEYTLAELEEKVCVKGGVTGKGIAVLEAETGDMFTKLFQATHKKFAEDKQETAAQFGIP
ncbi:late competence protein ComER [Bacillus badius]|uniref:Late competence protein ComER n=1 Tax=Bacillus badius TaxID=1455 RepID=A0ABR5AY13_BACBA|nr:late competence protein ComER [Bacillus badius]KIL75382.1 Late competence protein ComER [Bacillus badius]KIL79630.1 Late competence protein ComER [Bacillus badius]KZR57868.1 competence protein [Bacillus badius]MED4717305.1 late competence protein ComER [Bacillus badius]